MGRARHSQTTERMARIRAIVAERHPITVRGIAYQLFTLGLIPSMATKHVARVSRLCVLMREEGLLPWRWIVDETRRVEQAAAWDNPARFMKATLRYYRKDYWQQQPMHVEVWSEKGTVRGVLEPVLDRYAVAFRVQHGWASATSVHRAAEDTRFSPLGVCYTSALCGRL